jgi:hypothetical protein
MGLHLIPTSPLAIQRFIKCKDFFIFKKKIFYWYVSCLIGEKKRVFQIMECLLRQSFHVSRYLLNNKEKNTLSKMCFDCIEKIIASIYLARKPLGERHYKNKRLMQGGV